jgi:hypothetical protein
VAAILNGQEVIVSAVARRSDLSELRSKERIYARNLLRGADLPLHHIKASSKLLGGVNETSDEIFVGAGAGTAQDVPPLIAALKQKDDGLRVERTPLPGRLTAFSSGGPASALVSS